MKKIFILLALVQLTAINISKAAEGTALRACVTHVTYSDIEHAEEYFVGYGIDDFEACKKSKTACRIYQQNHNQMESVCITEPVTYDAYECRANLTTPAGRVHSTYAGISRDLENACKIALQKCKKSNLTLSYKCQLAESI